MIKATRMVGLNSDTDAALALILQPALPSESPIRESLYAIVSCSQEDAFSRVRTTLAQVEEFFSTPNGSLPQKLSQTLQLIKDSLKEAENLQILVASTQEDQEGVVLYLLYHSDNLKEDLVTSAPLKALFLRRSKQSDLCSISSDQLISGLLEDGDRVILTTQNFIDLLGGDLEHFDLLPLENLEDEVSARLPEAEIYPLATIVIEKVQKKEVGLGKLGGLSEAEEKITKERLSLNLKTAMDLASKIIPRSKRGMTFLGIILLICILVGAGLTFKNRKESDISSRFNQNFSLAREEFKKAQSMSETDPQGSSQSLDKAKIALREALKAKPQDPQASDLMKQIEQESPKILKVFTVSDFPLWLDLDLVKKDFTSQYLSLSGDKLLVFDDSKKIPVKINLASKAPQILAGEEKLGEGKLASINGEIVWVFSLDKGVVKIDSNQTTVAILPHQDWGKIIDLYGFAGNVYLLDEGNPSTGSGQIWKYIPIASGYEKKEYLAPEVKADFTRALRMQIDSSIWVLKGSGEILKYTKGVADFFSYSNLDKGINSPKSMFISDTTDNLYLLDSGNSRLLVLDKKGVYRTQYKSDRFQSFSDLAVDEKSKKVYLLDGSKIFQMDLK